MNNFKSALECAKDTIQEMMTSPDMSLEQRQALTILSLHYLASAVESLETWQRMLLDFHKARETAS